MTGRPRSLAGSADFGKFPDHLCESPPLYSRISVWLVIGFDHAFTQLPAVILTPSVCACKKNGNRVNLGCK